MTQLTSISNFELISSQVYLRMTEDDPLELNSGYISGKLQLTPTQILQLRNCWNPSIHISIRQFIKFHYTGIDIPVESLRRNFQVPLPKDLSDNFSSNTISFQLPLGCKHANSLSKFVSNEDSSNISPRVDINNLPVKLKVAEIGTFGNFPNFLLNMLQLNTDNVDSISEPVVLVDDIVSDDQLHPYENCHQFSERYCSCCPSWHNSYEGELFSIKHVVEVKLFTGWWFSYLFQSFSYPLQIIKYTSSERRKNKLRHSGALSSKLEVETSKLSKVVISLPSDGLIDLSTAGYTFKEKLSVEICVSIEHGNNSDISESVNTNNDLSSISLLIIRSESLGKAIISDKVIYVHDIMSNGVMASSDKIPATTTVNDFSKCYDFFVNDGRVNYSRHIHSLDDSHRYFYTHLHLYPQAEDSYTFYQSFNTSKFLNSNASGIDTFDTSGNSEYKIDAVYKESEGDENIDSMIEDSLSVSYTAKLVVTTSNNKVHWSSSKIDFYNSRPEFIEDENVV